ncbi:MAG TPA: aminopeptidase [Clostridiales bacterium]|nr:aminopeptidase [Clostridiales bacterium]
MSDSNNIKEKAKKLLYKRENIYIRFPALTEAIYEYSKGYRNFIDIAKTEREATLYAVKYASDRGFVSYEKGKQYKPGDKIYYVNRDKNIFLAVIGQDSLNMGCSIIVAHTDSPRIDLKQVPLYEDGGIGYFKTHYYGGLKKYQWTALPLSLHGVVYTKNNGRVEINIGEDEDDPVFYISDLMPHIGKDQAEKKLYEAISGEGLNIINGSIPYDSEDGVKLNVLSLLNEKYGIYEADLITAELTAVPAIKSREVGFDRSMIAAYGHDDRICAYPALSAICELGNIKKTAIAMFADKEEIGSEGVTGLRSASFKDFLANLCDMQNADIRDCCVNSLCFSADVGGAYDPCYAEAYEATNSAYLNKGVVVTKYTGSRGKSGSSDASAEVVSRVVKLLDKNEIVWQTGEYGKVDQGGAGTVATEIAMLNIDVIDVGVPILSMHSPLELAAKSDIYMMYRASLALYNDLLI